MQQLETPSTVEDGYAQVDGNEALPAEPWLTVGEIAERVKVHEQTVRRWLRSGALHGRNFGGKAGYRVLESEVERFMAALGDQVEETPITDLMVELAAARAEIARLRALLVRNRIDPEGGR